MTTAQEYLIENAPDLYQATLAVLDDSHQALKWRDEKIEKQARTIEELRQTKKQLAASVVEITEQGSTDRIRLAELEEKLGDSTAFCSGEFPCEAATEAAHLEARNKELEGEVEQHQHQWTALHDAFSPVRDWYDADGERGDIVAMVADAVADLQDNRQEYLDLRRCIAEIDREKS